MRRWIIAMLGILVIGVAGLGWWVQSDRVDFLPLLEELATSPVYGGVPAGGSVIGEDRSYHCVDPVSGFPGGFRRLVEVPETVSSDAVFRHYVEAGVAAGWRVEPSGNPPLVTLEVDLAEADAAGRIRVFEESGDRYLVSLDISSRAGCEPSPRIGQPAGMRPIPEGLIGRAP